jgi:subtilase family serine protease
MASRRLRGLLIGTFVLALWFGSQFAFGLLQTDKPELHPTTLLLEPASPVEQGRLVSVIAKLENTGSKAASAFKVEFFVRLRPGPGESAPSWTSFAVVELRGLSPEEQEIEVKGVLDTSDPELIPAPNVYEVRVVVDSNDQIPELDETNNELIVSLRVVPSKLGKPDLRPTTLTFEPPSPVSVQDTVLITAAVQNTGDRDASPFEVVFSYCFLPEGRTSCPTGFVELEGRLSFDGVLPKGSERRFTQELDIPALGLLPGHYLIKVTVDPPTPDQPAGRIEEQDEANNELVAALFIQGPELFPTSLSFEPALPRLGDAVKVTATVKNAGVGTAYNAEVAFFVDGARFALTTVTVEQDQEVLVEGVLKTDAFDLGVGVHTVRVIVDPDNRIAERDETNNEIRTALTLQPPVPRRAELHPKRLVVNPSSPIEIDPERSLTVLAEIVNTGEIEAQGFEVAFFYRATGRVRWVPLTCTAHCTIQSLAPGSGATAQGELALADLEPGNYELLVIVDPDDRVPELDEENNTMRSSFTLLAARWPDLALDPMRVRIEPSLQVQRGTAVRVRAVVTNAGEGPAGPFVVEFSWRRVEEEAFHTFARREIPGLALGNEIPVEATLDTTSLRPGLYELLIVVDPENRVAELDETNNVFSTGTSPEQAQPLSLRGPDLAILGVRFADPTLSPLSPLVTQGERVEIIAEITNSGVEATGAFEVEFCWRPVPTGAGEVSCQPFGERARFPGLGIGVVVQARAVLNTRDLAPGSYEIFVNVDPVQQGFPFGQVEEENELNNTGFLSLGVLPRPDLLVSSVRFALPSPVDPGTLVTVFAEILNAGEGPARKAFTVELGLRRLGEEECPTFATREMSRLASGESVVVRVELPTVELGTGGFELCVTVDPDDVIPELDETNNETDLPFAVGRRDLVVQAITLDPAPPLASDVRQATVFAEVTNEGEGPVIELFVVEFALRRLDPNPEEALQVFAQRTLVGLEAGGQVAAKAKLEAIGLRPGAYELCVTVDPEDHVVEKREDNNRRCLRFSVGLSDLLISDVTFDPARQVAFGQELKLFADVRNVGEGPALGSFVVEFAVRRVKPAEQPEFAVIARVELQDLTIGTQAAAKVELDTGQLAPGTYELRVIVDSENTLPELREDNNQLVARFGVGLPDLRVLQVNFDPVRQVPVGQPLQIFAKVGNEGEGPALEPFAVEFALRRVDAPFPTSFQPVGQVTISELAAGAQSTASIELDTTQLSPGVYELQVVVDPENTIPELDEGNNQLTARFAIGLPDLVIRGVAFDPAPSVVVGIPLKLLADVRNEGQGPALEAFVVEFALRREQGQGLFAPIGRVTVPGLAAGAQTTVQLELDTTLLEPGRYELLVTLDPANVITELNEQNNRLIVSLEIVTEAAANLPDLTIAELKLLPERARVREIVQIRAEIANIGGEDAGPFLVMFFYRRLGTDRLVNFAQVPLSGLQAGERKLLTVQLDTSIPWRGQFEILVRADARDQVEEADETNNEASKILEIY